MKKPGLDLLMSLYIHFAAVLTTATGQDIMHYYQCKDFNNQDISYYGLRCNASEVIIVDSAIVGATDKFNPPDQCPITKNTCLKEITIAADLCTWRNSCDISQSVQRTSELQLPCSINGNTVANFININYSCIVPAAGNFGNICHFDEDIHIGSPIYISSFPNFPNAMDNLSNYKCSCHLTPKLLSGPVKVIIHVRALLVKLTGAANCSERLSVVDSEGNDKLTFCSPCNNTKNVTEVPLTSNLMISFQRDADISPFNGKFILEITVQNLPSPIDTIGRMKCGFVSSTISSSAVITKASSSYISTKTTSVILGHSIGFGGSTNDDGMSSGMTVRSSNMSTSPEKSSISSSNPAFVSQNDASFSSIATPTDGGERTQLDSPALQTDSEKKPLSTGGIIGVVLGSIGLIVIVVIVVLCLLRKRKQLREHSKGSTNYRVQQSVTVIQNMHTTSRIELHEATDSELHTFGLATPLNKEPQIRVTENNSQMKDNPTLDYEEGALVCDGTYHRPEMTVANPQTPLNDRIADDLMTERRSLNSGDGDVTLVENQLYIENDRPMPDVASNDYDVARPILHVDDRREENSSGLGRGYVQMKNSSVGHSYYNVPASTEGGIIQSPAGVSSEVETNNTADAETSNTSDKTVGTNSMYKADSDVVLIDNTLYGSMLSF